MRTPREILLERHQAANAKLDEARHKALAQLKNEGFGVRQEAERHATTPTRSDVSKAVSPSRFAAAVQALWRELVLPRPHAWAGVAAIWIVILALKLSTHDGPPVAVKKTLLSPQVVAELKQQNAFFAELAGLPQLPEASPPNAVPPRPRSARDLEFRGA